MENNKNKNSIPEIAKKYEEHQYKPGFVASSYALLPYQEQRSVLDEANLYVNAHLISEVYGSWTATPGNAEKLLAAYCETYASDTNKVKELDKRYSEERTLHPLESDRNKDRSHKAAGIAKRIDRDYKLLNQNRRIPDAYVAFKTQQSRNA